MVELTRHLPPTPDSGEEVAHPSSKKYHLFWKKFAQFYRIICTVSFQGWGLNIIGLELGISVQPVPASTCTAFV